MILFFAHGNVRCCWFPPSTGHTVCSNPENSGFQVLPEFQGNKHFLSSYFDENTTKELVVLLKMFSLTKQLIIAVLPSYHITPRSDFMLLRAQGGFHTTTGLSKKTGDGGYIVPAALHLTACCVSAAVHKGAAVQQEVGEGFDFKEYCKDSDFQETTLTYDINNSLSGGFRCCPYI